MKDLPLQWKAPALLDTSSCYSGVDTDQSLFDPHNSDPFLLAPTKFKFDGIRDPLFNLEVLEKDRAKWPCHQKLV